MNMYVFVYIYISAFVDIQTYSFSFVCIYKLITDFKVLGWLIHELSLLEFENKILFSLFILNMINLVIKKNLNLSGLYFIKGRFL